MPTPNRRPHPSVSDVALALATRQRSERSVTAKVTTDNAKGEKRYTVEVTDPDAGFVLDTLKVLDADLAKMCADGAA